MPTVYQRRNPDGTKAKIYTADIWINGKKFPRSTGKQTRREAEKRAIEIEAELRAEFARKHEPLTLDKLMGKYWEDHAGDLPSAPSVMYHMARLLEILGKDLPLAELSNKHVNNYVTVRKRQLARTLSPKKPARTLTGLQPGQASQQGYYTRKNGVRVRMPVRAVQPLVPKVVKKDRQRKPVSHATINRELDVLQAAYIKARDSWEHPVRPINWGDHRFEKTERGDHTLSFEEARQAVLLARPKSRDMADAIELSFYTGMRQNELETIIPARIHLERREVIVLAKRKARQGYRERTVFLNRAAVALLAERLRPGLDPQGPLFDLKNGRKIWEWVRAQIGRTDVRWHDLRHTHASMLAKATKDPHVVQRQLGHTHIKTSMGYIHTEDPQVIEGVEAIPQLSDRTVVVLKPDAENGAGPPSFSTIIKPATEKGAHM